MFVTEEPDWRYKVIWLLAPIPGIAGWLFLTAWLSTLWGVRANLVLYGLLMLCLIALVLALVLAAVSLYGHLAAEYGDLMLIVTDKGFLLTCWSGVPMAYLALSGQLCNYLSTSFGGFATNSASYWQWLWVSVSLIADGLWHLTTFGSYAPRLGPYPTASWSIALVAMLNVLLVVGIVGLGLLWRAGWWGCVVYAERKDGASR